MEKKHIEEYLKNYSKEQEWKGAYSKIYLITIDGEKMIIKQFNRNDYYQTEKKVLIKLQHWEDCFPKIKYYDDNSKTVITKYVGENISNIFKKNPEFNLADYEEKIYECNQKIKRAGFYHNDCNTKNLCIDDEGVLRFIDFECCHPNHLNHKKDYGPFAYRNWKNIYRPYEDQKEKIAIWDEKYDMAFWYCRDPMYVHQPRAKEGRNRKN